MKLQAVRALAIEVFEEAFAPVSAGNVIDTQLQAKAGTMGAFAPNVATEVVSTSFLFCGEFAVFKSYELQRCHRNSGSAFTCQ